MLATNDAEIYTKVLALSNHGRTGGQVKQFWPDMVGFKYKLSNLQAAVGCAQTERIEELVSTRRSIFAYYADHFCDLPIKMNPEPVGTINGCWMPTIVVDEGIAFDREDLLARFKTDNIDGRVFFWPLSMLSMFEAKCGNTVSYGLFKRAVNLPSYHDIRNADMDRVIKHVRACF